MTALFRDGGEPIGPGDVAVCEERSGIKFPPEYVSFLLATNGGTPTPQMLDIPNTEHSVLVDYLYGIRSGRETGDLEYELAQVRDDVPPGFVVIGHDPGGNAYLLATEGEQQGQVFFWDKGRVLTKNESGNTFWLADRFSAFLGMLY